MGRNARPAALSALIVVAALVCGAPDALASHVACGDQISSDVTLDSDLVDCVNGLEVTASGVDIDLNGHTIDGNARWPYGQSDTGIWAFDVDHVTVKNGVIKQFGRAVELAQVDDSVVSGLTIDQAGIGIWVRRNPDRNLIENNTLFSADIRVDEEAYLAFQTFRPSGNRVENNRFIDRGYGNQISFHIIDGGVIADNEIENGSINVSGTPPSSGDNPAEENTVEGNQVSGGNGMTIGNARANVISDNVVRDSYYGITVLYSDANRVEQNWSYGNTLAGVQVGNLSYPAANDVIADNLLFGNTDGVLVNTGARGTAVERNIAWGNSDDGFDADHADTSFTGNFAFDNSDWGIEALVGTTDGGGNRAWANGQAAQCLNVSCEPPDACGIRGAGAIVADNGDAARFRASLRFDGEAVGGTFLYVDQGPAEPVEIRSRPSGIVCDGSGSARVLGETEVEGSIVPFIADLVDGGSPKRDRFRIRLGSGYDSGSQPLESGRIRIR